MESRLYPSGISYPKQKQSWSYMDRDFIFCLPTCLKIHPKTSKFNILRRFMIINEELYEITIKHQPQAHTEHQNTHLLFMYYFYIQKHILTRLLYKHPHTRT